MQNDLIEKVEIPKDLFDHKQDVCSHVVA